MLSQIKTTILISEIFKLVLSQCIYVSYKIPLKIRSQYIEFSKTDSKQLFLKIIIIKSTAQLKG